MEPTIEKGLQLIELYHGKSVYITWLERLLEVANLHTKIHIHFSFILYAILDSLSILTTMKLFSPIKILSLSFLVAVVFITGCETNGAEDTLVIFDEDSNDVTFANKKYNRKLAAREEQKWRDKKTIYKTGSTAANPAGGLERPPEEQEQAQAEQQTASSQVYNYNANPNLRYGTDAPIDYEEYKRWRAASGTEDSAEYQRFKLWQEFEEYRNWRESLDNQPE